MMDVMNKSLAAPQAMREQTLPTEKKGKTPSESGFADALTQAGVAEQALASMATPVPVATSTNVSLTGAAQEAAKNEVATNEIAKNEAVKNEAVTAALTKKGQSVTSIAESPLNQKSAAGPTTAAAIAGLKPWSKEWVFQGTEEARPELRTLLQEKTAGKGVIPNSAENPEVMPEVLEQTTKAAQSLQRQTRGEAQVASLAQLGQAAAADQVKSSDPLRDSMENSWSAQLGTQLNSMNGVMEDVSGVARERSMQSPKSLQNLGPVAGGLSGAEFLDTLQGVKQSELARPDRGAPNLKVIPGGTQAGSLSKGLPKGFPMMKGPGIAVDEVAEKAIQSSKLRAIDGGNSSAMALGGTVGLQINAERPTISPMTVTGHVVPGAMAQERLSSESLIGVSSGIQNLTTRGGGEMRIRLKPENLGELHLRVVTDGTQVSLHVRASDERAKGIIEGSMSHLKDSLAAHQLTLGNVDLSVANLASAGDQFSSKQQNDQGPQQQANYQGSDSLGQSGGQGKGREQWNQTEVGLETAPPSVKSARVAASGGGRAQSGRLDLMA